MKNEKTIEEKLREKFWLKADRCSCCGDLNIKMDQKQNLALVVAEEEYSPASGGYSQVRYHVNLYDIKKDKVAWSKTSGYQDISGTNRYEKYSPEYRNKKLYLLKETRERKYSGMPFREYKTVYAERAKCTSKRDMEKIL